MQVNKELNLVIPINREDGATLYAYSIPVPRSVFRRYYEIFARAFNKIYAGGIGLMAAPRVAGWILEETAKEIGMWDGPEGAERGLMQEIRRLTNVIVLGEKGWEPIPLHEAIAKGLLDEVEGEGIEHAAAFFTLAWHYHRIEDRKQIMEGASKLWGGHLESLSYTEFCNSLSTSTTPGTTPSTPETTPALQVPS